MTAAFLTELAELRDGFLTELLHEAWDGSLALARMRGTAWHLASSPVRTNHAPWLDHAARGRLLGGWI